MGIIATKDIEMLSKLIFLFCDMIIVICLCSENECHASRVVIMHSIILLVVREGKIKTKNVSIKITYTAETILFLILIELVFTLKIRRKKSVPLFFCTLRVDVPKKILLSFPFPVVSNGTILVGCIIDRRFQIISFRCGRTAKTDKDT